MERKLTRVVCDSILIGLILLTAVGCEGNGTTAVVAPVDYRSGIEALGAQIFNDTNLSEPPGQSCAVNRDELGHLHLTDAEVDDIVAFLMTLTDGYAASH